MDDVYICPECNWKGTECEMKGDYIACDFWSNHICPYCGYWHIDLEDYIKGENERSNSITTRR